MFCLKSLNLSNFNNVNHIHKMFYYISNNCEIIKNDFNITINLKTIQKNIKYINKKY